MSDEKHRRPSCGPGELEHSPASSLRGGRPHASGTYMCSTSPWFRQARKLFSAKPRNGDERCSPCPLGRDPSAAQPSRGQRCTVVLCRFRGLCWRQSVSVLGANWSPRCSIHFLMTKKNKLVSGKSNNPNKHRLPRTYKIITDGVGLQTRHPYMQPIRGEGKQSPPRQKETFKRQSQIRSKRHNQQIGSKVKDC